MAVGASHFWSANVSFAERLVRYWIDRERLAPTSEKRCFYKNGMLPMAVDCLKVYLWFFAQTVGWHYFLFFTPLL